jgi:hypothetical protein
VKPNAPQQAYGIGVNRNPGTEFAGSGSLFENRHAQATRPQCKRSRQATDPGSHDGNLKFVRHRNCSFGQASPSLLIRLRALTKRSIVS